MFYKKIIYPLILAFLLLILIEVGFRWIYFQQYGREAFAFLTAVNYIKREMLKKIAAYKVGKLEIPKGAHEALYSDEGRRLLEYFQSKYESYFKILVTETQGVKSKLVVLYIPSEDYVRLKQRRESCREFFLNITQKFNMHFLDLSQEFLKYPVERITLLPENGHLSRFGNMVVAEELTETIKKYDNYRADFKFAKRPRLLGDLAPNDNRVWEIAPNMPYRVVTNSQGLRMGYDLIFPKKKQRILILGDSYTFGPYVPNSQTYPELINKMCPDKEVVNAGVAGYTIIDEVMLFVERAKYVEPDITILQVLDNDLYELFYFKRLQSLRNDKIDRPSEIEVEFIRKMREKGVK
jgi:hypothetical protein